MLTQAPAALNRVQVPRIERSPRFRPLLYLESPFFLLPLIPVFPLKLKIVSPLEHPSQPHPISLGPPPLPMHAFPRHRPWRTEILHLLVCLLSHTLSSLRWQGPSLPKAPVILIWDVPPTLAYNLAYKKHSIYLGWMHECLGRNRDKWIFCNKRIVEVLWVIDSSCTGLLIELPKTLKIDLLNTAPSEITGTEQMFNKHLSMNKWKCEYVNTTFF